jgi:2-keto-3-deoxy-6-phosphogluconate aldolase
MTRALLCLVLALAIFPAEARIHRSTAAKHEFMAQTVCPATGRIEKRHCQGYVVDHIKALACGGADRPENMQYQTIADGKAKDKWERKGCGK